MPFNKNAKRRLIKSSAAESVTVLLNKAEENFELNKARSKRYVEMAWKLITRNKIRLTDAQTSMFCRKCLTFWKINKTLAITFDKRNNSFYYNCNICGYKRMIKKKKV